MRPYRDFNRYLRECFGERVWKIALDAGMSCPNRDGTLSFEGCTFCDPRGSGSGALSGEGLSIEEQLEGGILHASRRYGVRKFIAYFQSFTNTYGPVPMLKSMYDRALARQDVVGLAVGTRPDCAGDEVLDLLASYSERVQVWVEYGLQSAHDATLRAINRGHDAACFEQAVRQTARRGLHVCAHIILGLPGESRDMMVETARFIASLPVHGLKIHMLYVIEGTALARQCRQDGLLFLDLETYADIVVDVLEQLSGDVVIQRLTGDPPKGLALVAPDWVRDKGKTLRRIRERLEERDAWQGKQYGGPPKSDLETQRRSSSGPP